MTQHFPGQGWPITGFEQQSHARSRNYVSGVRNRDGPSQFKSRHGSVRVRNRGGLWQVGSWRPRHSLGWSVKDWEQQWAISGDDPPHVRGENDPSRFEDDPSNVGINPVHKSHIALGKYSAMHHFVTEICTCVHIFATKWCILSICLIHCGICETGLLGLAHHPLWSGMAHHCLGAGMTHHRMARHKVK